MAASSRSSLRSTEAFTVQSSREQVLLALIAAGIFAAIACLFRRYGLPLGLASFWDASIYAAAFRSSAAHGNPYTLATQLLFVYPPFFLHVGAFFYRIVHGQLAWHTFISLSFVALLLSPTLMSMYYFRARWLTPALAVLLFAIAPALVAESAFFTGNLANILYAALLLTGVPGIRRGRWLSFYLMLACAGFIKLPMLCFLLLPLLLDSNQVLASVFTVVGVFALNLVTRLTDPAEYAAYLEAVRTQVVVHHDLGYGLVYSGYRLVLRHPSLPHMLPYAAQLLMAGAIVGMLLVLRLRHWPGVTRSQSVAAVLLAALLCNPRLQAYDLNQFAVPSVYLLVELTLLYRRRRNSLLCLALSVFFLFMLALLAPQKSIYLTGLLAVFALAWHGLRSANHRPEQLRAAA